MSSSDENTSNENLKVNQTDIGIGRIVYYLGNNTSLFRSVFKLVCIQIS